MKGVILAGGGGSRLYPVTKVVNKHLIPVGDKPMIIHAVEKLVEAGLPEILIVGSGDSLGDIVKLLGSGKEFFCKLSYRVQDEPNGIAKALEAAEDFADNEPIVVLLGDNIFQDSLKEYVEEFKKEAQGATVFLKDVPDPSRYGIAEVNRDKIVSIEEKPQNPRASYCVTGIYMYDNKVFEIIKKLKPSARGEYEISDVNMVYLKRGELSHKILKGWWVDAGTFDSLREAIQLVSGEKDR